MFASRSVSDSTLSAGRSSCPSSFWLACSSLWARRCSTFCRSRCSADCRVRWAGCSWPRTGSSSIAASPAEPGSERVNQRLGPEPVAHLHEGYLRAQPERILCDVAHGLGCVVAEEKNPLAQHNECLDLRSKSVPGELELAGGVFVGQQVRPQVPDIVDEIILKILLPRPDVSEQSGLVLDQCHHRPLVEHRLLVQVVHPVGGRRNQRDHFIQCHRLLISLKLPRSKTTLSGRNK